MSAKNVSNINPILTKNCKRKAATTASQNLTKRQSSRLHRVSALLRKKNKLALTEDEKLFLKENSDLVNQFNKRKEKRAENERRLTEHEDSHEELDAKCLELAQAIHDAEFVVVYTGAGISTSASIPDYRGPNGIWTRLRRGQTIGTHDLTIAEPTLTHMAVSTLYNKGIVRHVVSQNCDGLHLRSGLPKSALSEVHGNMYIEVCRYCRPTREYVRIFDVTENTSTFKHKTGRRCYRCGEPLVDTIVHFGERGKLRWPLNWQGACQAAKACDTILCLGSSLKVLRKYSWLWQMDRPLKRRPRLYIVNLQWTPKDKDATLKINGKCDDVMGLVMKYLGVPISKYVKKEDPIFHMYTSLHSDEISTFSQHIITPPDDSEDEAGDDRFNPPLKLSPDDHLGNNQDLSASSANTTLYSSSLISTNCVNKCIKPLVDGPSLNTYSLNNDSSNLDDKIGNLGKLKECHYCKVKICKCIFEPKIKVESDDLCEKLNRLKSEGLKNGEIKFDLSINKVTVKSENHVNFISKIVNSESTEIIHTVKSESTEIDRTVKRESTEIDHTVKRENTEFDHTVKSEIHEIDQNASNINNKIDRNVHNNSSDKFQGLKDKIFNDQNHIGPDFKTIGNINNKSDDQKNIEIFNDKNDSSYELRSCADSHDELKTFTDSHDELKSCTDSHNELKSCIDSHDELKSCTDSHNELKSYIDSHDELKPCNDSHELKPCNDSHDELKSCNDSCHKLKSNNQSIETKKEIDFYGTGLCIRSCNLSSNDNDSTNSDVDKSPYLDFTDKEEELIQNEENIIEMDTEESSQLMEQNNTNLRSLQQYEENVESLHQYEENVESLQQYEENVESLQQYEENVESFQQYKENIESLQQYGVNVESLQQYEENVESLQQYVENVESIQQNEENLELLQQNEENVESIEQDEENLELIEDENEENLELVENLEENEEINKISQETSPVTHKKGCFNQSTLISENLIKSNCFTHDKNMAIKDKRINKMKNMNGLTKNILNLEKDIKKMGNDVKNGTWRNSNELKEIWCSSFSDKEERKKDFPKLLHDHLDDEVKRLWFWGFESAPKEEKPTRRVTRSSFKKNFPDEKKGCNCVAANPQLCQKGQERNDTATPEASMIKVRESLKRKRIMNYVKYEPVFEISLQDVTYKRSRKRKVKYESDDSPEESEGNGHDFSEIKNKFDYKKIVPGWYGKGYRKVYRKKKYHNSILSS